MHTFHQLSSHVYYLTPDATTDRPVLGVVAGRRGSLLIDAGNSPAHAQLLLAEVAGTTVSAPMFLVLTHWHWDHVFGLSTFDLPILAHHLTGCHLAEMASLDWGDAALDERVAAGVELAFCRDMMKLELSPQQRGHLRLRPPDISYTDRLEIDLGGVTALVAHVGGDHAADSSIVFIAEERVVFLSDCLYPSIYEEPSRYTAARLFPLLDQLLAYEADFYLWGHDPKPMSRTALAKEADMLRTIGDIVRPGLSREEVRREVGRTLARPLNEYHEEVIDAFWAGLAGDV